VKTAARAFVLALLGMAAAAARLPGQDKARELTHQVSVTAVTLAVSVQDRGGRYVTDLTAKDFKVLENGQPRAINYFKSSYDAPVSLTVLLDVSGSMALQDRLADGREALTSVLGAALRPGDEVALLVFADGQVEVAFPFSTDKAGFFAALNAQEAYGQTALNDAVAVSPEFALRGRNEKRALILLTDGIENDSRTTPGQATDLARRVEVPIFAVGYRIPLSERYLMTYKRSAALSAAGIVDSLKAFAEATGGKAYVPDSPADLRSALRAIVADLSHQYILGYTTYTAQQNEYRKITVVASNPRYRVRTRQGY
jgi:Ca-activated chloride channel family protein